MAMAMQLERLQAQAVLGSGPRRKAPGAQSAGSLSFLRYTHSSMETRYFCPRPGESGQSKPLSVPQASAGQDSGEADDGRKEKRKDFLVFIFHLVKRAFQLAGVIFILSTAFAAAAPAILSTPRGRKTIMAMASSAIPGTISVAHASLGWRKPVYLEGITLKGVDGKTVASISKVETRASLLSIVRGKKGFGEATITEPFVDLQEDVETGHPRLAQALSKPQATVPKSKTPATAAAAAEVSVTASFNSVRGGLELVKGKLLLPEDAAATIGPSIFLDVAEGRFATEVNEALASASSEYPGQMPVHGKLYSDRAQVEFLGFADLPSGQVQLLRPVKLEVDLTPEVGKLFFARVNPLLGEIVGPAIDDDDLPDITLYVAPADFRFPSNEYDIRIEPMKATLAKGQLVNGLLNLLSRQDLLRGRSQIRALTSPIQANINLKTGLVSCDRLDLLLADTVHVASWGVVNVLQETVQMTLAIPGSTLRKTLGLSKLGHDYFLKIPLLGSLSRPQVDFRAAAKGIAQLTLQQQGGPAGELFSTFFQESVEEARASEVPKPLDVLPWDTRP